MTRHTHTNREPESNELANVVNEAITRYCDQHRSLSHDRQEDIRFLKAILLDTSRIAVQQHIAIGKHVRSLKVGLFKRSDLRDYVLEALARVPLDGLINELLRRHEAELRAQEMKAHAAQPAQAIAAAPDLAVTAIEADLIAAQEANQQIEEEVGRLLNIYQELIRKYKNLKREYIILCKKHDEPCFLFADLLSQFSGDVSDPIVINDSAISDAREEVAIASSGASNGQLLFKTGMGSKGSQTFITGLSKKT